MAATGKHTKEGGKQKGEKMATDFAMSTRSKRRFDALMEQTYKKVFNLTYDWQETGSMLKT